MELDADLLRAYVDRRDGEALGALVRRHQAEVFDLVRRILRRDDLAEDATQETFVRLVRSAASWRGEGTVRVWLLRTAVNAARNVIRGESRRAKHEGTAGERPRTTVPSAEAGAVHAELRAAVAELPEDLQLPVVLHYFRGLSHAETADVLGAPTGTVAARIHRAKERLRERLASVAILPAVWEAALPTVTDLAPIPASLPVRLLEVLEREHVAPTAVAGSTRADGRRHPGWVALAGLAMVLIPTAFFVAARTEGSPNVRAAPLAGPAVPLVPSPPRGTPAGPSELPGLTPVAPSPSRPDRADRPEGVIRGVVLAPGSGTPVAGATVIATATRGTRPDGIAAPPDDPARSETRSGPDGWFRMEGLPVGAYRLAATKEGVGMREITAAARPTTSPYVFERWLVAPDPAPALLVRVRNSDGSPGIGAQVELTRATGAPPIVGTADRDGCVAFRGIEIERGIVVARGSGGVAMVPLYRDDAVKEARAAGGLEMTLGPPGRLAGTVSAATGISPGGAVVEAWALSWPRAEYSAVGILHSTIVATDGTYAIESLPSGTYQVLVRGPGNVRCELPRRAGQYAPPDYEIPTVDVASGATATLDLRVAPGGLLRGRVVRADTGASVRGARVECILTSGLGSDPARVVLDGAHVWRFDYPTPHPEEEAHPFTFRLVMTDADGRYELAGLMPDSGYRVRVIPPPDLAFEVREEVSIDAGQETELAHALQPAGTLEALVGGGNYIGLRPAGTERATIVLILPDDAAGAICIPGLAAGDWEIGPVYWDQPLAPLARFTIRPSATTYVDALEAGAARISAVLLRDGVPVAGARVNLWTEALAIRTDASGRFERRVHRPWNQIQLDVQPPEPDAARLILRSRTGMTAGTDWEERFELPPAHRLTVIVLGPDGLPSPDMRVDLELGADPTSGSTGNGVIKGAAGPEVVGWDLDRRTDAAGRASWIGLPPGPYVITATLAGGAAAHRRLVRVGSEPAVEVVLDQPWTAALRVTVLAPDGQPAAKARVYAALLPGEDDPGPDDPARWNRARESREATTGLDGIAWLRALPRGVVRVTAMRGSGWSPEEESPVTEAAVGAGGEHALTVRLAARRDD